MAPNMLPWSVSATAGIPASLTALVSPGGRAGVAAPYRPSLCPRPGRPPRGHPRLLDRVDHVGQAVGPVEQAELAVQMKVNEVGHPGRTLPEQETAPTPTHPPRGAGP